MKTCPISNKPIDVMKHADTAWQVISHGGYWHSKLFTNGREALEFLQGFNIAESYTDSTEVVDYESGKVRLVGEGWETRFMAADGLKAWKAKLKASLAPATRTKAKANAPTT